MTTESKLVPVALLNDIEATWREASAFSNTANNLIERRLPELRALLAAPATRQYYYRKDGCKAYATTDSDCICWHDEGTGPLFNNPMTTVQPSSWRDKPQSELDVLRQDLATAKRNEHNSEVAYKAAIERQDELRAELAALREELAKSKEALHKEEKLLILLSDQKDAISYRLTAAEQRNAALVQQASQAFESAARWVESRRDEYVNDHGSLDPETGTVGLPGNGEEYVGELDEIAEGLRSLKPTESGASDAERKEDDRWLQMKDDQERADWNE